MKKIFVAALMCGVISVEPASAAVFAPATAVAAKPAVQTAVGAEGATVTEVRWRGHRPRHYHRHRHRHRGAGAFGAGLAVGVIGALIAKGVSESTARDRYNRCAAEFRSFDPETGTYITKSGHERLCPYLR